MPESQSEPYYDVNFSLELFPDAPDVVEKSRSILHSRARSLIESIAHQYNFPVSRKREWVFDYSDASTEKNHMISLCTNLEDLACWRILESLQGASRQVIEGNARFDGWMSRNGLEKQLIAEQEKRSRAQRLLIKEWYQEAFTIAVNSALLSERDDKPGYWIGHSLLLRDIVWNDESPFKSAVTPQFLERLHNGSFWENLEGFSRGTNSGSSYMYVDTILRHHYDDLTPVWLPLGLKIHERNTYKGKNSERMEYDPEHLPVKSFVRLAKLFQSFDEHLYSLQISQERFGYVVAPLARTIIRLTGDINDEEIDYMSDADIRKRDRIRGISQKLSEMPIIQKYKNFERERKSNVASLVY